jgi:hypothetical protein
VNYTVQARNEYKAISSANFKNLENPRVENRNRKLTIIYPRKHPAQFAGYEVHTRIITSLAAIIALNIYDVNTHISLLYSEYTPQNWKNKDDMYCIPL